MNAKYSLVIIIHISVRQNRLQQFYCKNLFFIEKLVRVHAIKNAELIYTDGNILCKESSFR